ncbi:hypothetical protein GQ600_15096 [Phytophthora cactorum]|nr:hypothetical protein GQ600_15096 [Phytophthora cactorum]
MRERTQEKQQCITTLTRDEIDFPNPDLPDDLLWSHKTTQVSGMGDFPTNITASAQVKIALGFGVVYILAFWVANIGEGIEVLCGMNFMFAAGIRFV